MTTKPLTKPQCEAIYLRRLPAYRALASMPPSNHWPNRQEPFDWQKSEITRFIRGYLPDATKSEVRNMIQSARSDLGLIGFVRGTRCWVGTGDTSKLRCVPQALGGVRQREGCGTKSVGQVILADLDDQAVAALVDGFNAVVGLWNGQKQSYDFMPDCRTRLKSAKLWMACKGRMSPAMQVRVQVALQNRNAAARAATAPTAI